MKIFNLFRKPYLSIFLALLVLFASCQVSDEPIDDNLQFDITDFNQYIDMHIELISQLMIELEGQEDIDLEVLFNVPENVEMEEISTIFDQARFKNSEIISRMLIQIQDNIFELLQKNPNFRNLNESEIQNILTTEIDNRLKEESILFSAGDSCREAFDRARDRCERNFAISVAALGISGFFTFGIGTAVGAVAASAILVLCTDDAQSDYENCSGHGA